MRIAPIKGQEDMPVSLLGTAYVPDIGRAAMEFSRVTYVSSRLSLREFEAARAVTAIINGCQLCQSWRSSTDLPIYLKGLGHTGNASIADNGPAPDEAFYQAVGNWRGSDLFSERERIAIELAEGMGQAPQAIAADEDFWSRVHTHFTDAEIVDLTYCISCWIGLGRMTHVLGLDSVCGLPAAMPRVTQAA